MNRRTKFLVLLALTSCEPPCQSGTTGGSCNVVDQCGCPGSEICNISSTTATCDWQERCQAWAHGQLDVGDECVLGAGDPETGEGCCRTGTLCWSDDPLGGVGSCHEWCRDDGDCSVPGALCQVDVGGSFGFQPYCPDVQVIAPYRVCTLE